VKLQQSHYTIISQPGNELVGFCVSPEGTGNCNFKTFTVQLFSTIFKKHYTFTTYNLIMSVYPVDKFAIWNFGAGFCIHYKCVHSNFKLYFYEVKNKYLPNTCQVNNKYLLYRERCGEMLVRVFSPLQRWVHGIKGFGWRRMFCQHRIQGEIVF